MSISIVIPLYNKEKHIKNTIEHVLQQTYQDFEIVVLNDGSTDKSAEVVRSINDERIKLYEQENQGASVTRNNAVKLAKNELVAFLDADDEWKENYLESLWGLYSEYPNAVIYGTNYEIIENGEKIILNFPGITDEVGLIKSYFASGKVFTPLWTSAVMVKKSIFIELGGFPVSCKICEDVDLWCRFACRGEMAYINRPLAIYRRDSTNMLSKSTDASNYFPFLDDYVDLISEKDDRWDDVLEYIEHRRLFAVSYAILTAHNSKMAREIIKKIRPNIKNKKKLNGYLIMSFLPKWLLKFYVKSKQKGR